MEVPLGYTGARRSEVTMSDTQDGFRDIPWNRVFTGGGTAAFYASLVVFIALCVFVTNRDLAFDASRPFALVAREVRGHHFRRRT